MKIVYDVALRQFSFDAATVGPYGANISAALNRHGINVIFRDLQFGVQVRRNGVLSLDLSFPPPGIVYKSTDQNAILAVRSAWLPDETLDFDVWMINARARVDGAFQMVVPKPAPPFASWLWASGGWVPPVPYPTGAGAYDWSEAAGDWVTV
jgi:hypothetical protein